MFIRRKKLAFLEERIEKLESAARSQYICKNCSCVFHLDDRLSRQIFSRGRQIYSREIFNYCPACRPKMKKEAALDKWIAQNRSLVQAYRDSYIQASENEPCNSEENPNG